jgi:2-polyprenyl-3-methyl-5-hydroxy-6-metoxy-1,4-benzoquinol methylase
VDSAQRTNPKASRYSVDIDLKNVNNPHTLAIGRVPANSCVLDLGLADGSVAAVLKDMGCRVWGVEIDPVAAKEAQSVCEDVAVDDLSTIDLETRFAGQSFDVVLMLDVLEHLSDPVSVLKRVSSVLHEGGWGVISIPNVAHLSVRLALLRGRFTYTDTGLLDRTHLRFFDRDGVDDLLRQAGWGMFDMARVIAPFGTTEIDIEDADPQLVRELESDAEGQTYQFVVSVAPLGSAILEHPPTLPALAAQRRVRELFTEAEQVQAHHSGYEAGLSAQNQALESELGALRHDNQQLRDELLRLYDTKLFRWAAPARISYARLRYWRTVRGKLIDRSRSGREHGR